MAGYLVKLGSIMVAKEICSKTSVIRPSVRLKKGSHYWRRTGRCILTTILARRTVVYSIAGRGKKVLGIFITIV